MPHILLVEDDKDLCNMLAYLLRNQGYTVTAVTDGFSALQQFKKQHPDLILLDLMIPKIDGIEVCWRIRGFSRVPIIIISAKNQNVDVRWGYKAGADDYIKKPFDVEIILQRISTVLQSAGGFSNEDLPPLLDLGAG